MNWTTPEAIRDRLERLWQRGDLLRERVIGNRCFPLRLKLKGPGSRELADRFDAVRTWSRSLQSMVHGRIEMRSFNHRVLGRNQLPDVVCFDTLEEAVALLRHGGELKRFEAVIEATEVRSPALLDWLAQRPLKALELAEAWPHLLTVVEWLLHHPRPAIYLRQIDLSGIHTKFIEAHRGILGELLDRVLPDAAIDRSQSGSGHFARRYGFLDKPARIRFRILDPRHAVLPGDHLHDITLDSDSLRQLEPTVRRLFITENETNFLAFPATTDSMVLFGAGYGFETLGRIDWLHRCQIYYWGDIDTHGFAILDQLRSHFPHAESLLMDRQTLLAHKTQWGREAQPCQRQLPRLTADEAALYDALCQHAYGDHLRLEQERIGYDYLCARLAQFD